MSGCVCVCVDAVEYNNYKGEPRPLIAIERCRADKSLVEMDSRPTGAILVNTRCMSRWLISSHSQQDHKEPHTHARARDAGEASSLRNEAHETKMTESVPKTGSPFCAIQQTCAPGPTRNAKKGASLVQDAAPSRGIIRRSCCSSPASQLAGRKWCLPASPSVRTVTRKSFRNVTMTQRDGTAAAVAAYAGGQFYSPTVCVCATCTPALR